MYVVLRTPGVNLDSYASVARMFNPSLLAKLLFRYPGGELCPRIESQDPSVASRMLLGKELIPSTPFLGAPLIVHTIACSAERGYHDGCVPVQKHEYHYDLPEVSCHPAVFHPTQDGRPARNMRQRNAAHV